MSTHDALFLGPSHHRPHFADGLYELFYRSEGPNAGSRESLLLFVRDGRLLGADRWGGVISGQHCFDADERRHRFVVELDVPANGILVTGVHPPESRQTIELVADLGGAPYNAHGRVDLFGEPVSLELVYRGPLALPGDPRCPAER